MRPLNLLADDLAPGDLLLSCGIGGARGLVTRVSVLTRCVAVWLADGSAHSLGLMEAVSVMRPGCQHEDDGGPFFAKCRKCGADLEDFAGWGDSAPARPPPPGSRYRPPESEEV